jgi:hypothetical protein
MRPYKNNQNQSITHKSSISQFSSVSSSSSHEIMRKLNSSETAVNQKDENTKAEQHQEGVTLDDLIKAAPFESIEQLMDAYLSDAYVTQRETLAQIMGDIVEQLLYDDVETVTYILQFANTNDPYVIQKLSESFIKHLNERGKETAFPAMFESLILFLLHPKIDKLNISDAINLLKALLLCINQDISPADYGRFYPACCAVVQLITRMLEMEVHGVQFYLNLKAQKDYQATLEDAIKQLNGIIAVKKEAAEKGKDVELIDGNEQVTKAILQEAVGLLVNLQSDQSNSAAQLALLKETGFFLLNIVACATACYGATQSFGLFAPGAISQCITTGKQARGLFSPLGTVLRKKIFGFKTHELLSGFAEDFFKFDTSSRVRFISKLDDYKKGKLQYKSNGKTKRLDLSEHFNEIDFRTGLIRMFQFAVDEFTEIEIPFIVHLLLRFSQESLPQDKHQDVTVYQANLRTNIFYLLQKLAMRFPALQILETFEVREAQPYFESEFVKQQESNVPSSSYASSVKETMENAWFARYNGDEDLWDLYKKYRDDELDELRAGNENFFLRLKTKIEHKEKVISPWGSLTFPLIRDVIDQSLRQPSVKVQFKTYLTYLRAYYQTDVNCSSVQLLFGGQKHITDCFVDLTIFKQAKQREREQEQQALDRDSYLTWHEDIYREQNKEPISIEEIFKERQGKKEQRKRFPKRILIHGWMGTGKTTLLREIVYEWATKKLWIEQFRFVLWIQLRSINAGEIAKQNNLANIIELELFDGAAKHQLTTEQFKTFIYQYSNQVLFLLDGYDELNTNTESAKVIRQLLQNPDWYMIVTSRSTTNIPVDFDSILETIGFTDENITVYIHQFFKDNQQQARIIHDFLKNNFSIYGLAHTPIFLELICSVFEKDLPPENSMTMTALYQRVEAKLWERAVRKITTKNEHELCGKLTKEQREDQTNIRCYLRSLAFYSVKQNHYMIPEEDLEEILHKVYGDEIFDEEMIAYLKDVLFPGFLHSRHINEHHKHYYFSHLTFQEFFAARYLVECLLSKEAEAIETATKFIRKHKYEQRLQYVFWFAVGLLNSAANHNNKKSNQNGITALNQFFDVFFQAPRDLIGNYEALFLMRCLEEGHMLEKLDEKYRQVIWRTVLDIISQILYLEIHPDDFKNISHTLLRCPRIIQSVLVEKLLLDLLNSNLDGLKDLSKNTIALLTDILPYCRLEFLHQTFFPQLFTTLSDSSKISNHVDILKLLNQYYDKLSEDNLLSLAQKIPNWLAHNDEDVGTQAMELFNKYFDKMLSMRGFMSAISAYFDKNDDRFKNIMDNLSKKLHFSQLLKFPLLQFPLYYQSILCKAREENIKIFYTKENGQFYLHYGQQAFNKISLDDEEIIKNAKKCVNTLLHMAKTHRKSTQYDACFRAMECYGAAFAITRECNLDNARNIQDKMIDLIKKYFAYQNFTIKHTIGTEYLEKQLKSYQQQLILIRLREEEKHELPIETYQVTVTNELTKLFKDMCQFCSDLLLSEEQIKGMTVILLGSLATQQALPYSDVEYIILLDEQIAQKNRIAYEAFASLLELLIISLGETPLYRVNKEIEENGLLGIVFEFCLYKGFRVDETKKTTAVDWPVTLVNTVEGFTDPKLIRTFRPGNHMAAALLCPAFLLGNEVLFKQYRIRLHERMRNGDYNDFLSRLISHTLQEQQVLKDDIEFHKISGKENYRINIKELALPSINLVFELVFLLYSQKKITELPEAMSVWNMMHTLQACLDLAKSEEHYRVWYEFIHQCMELQRQKVVACQRYNIEIELRKLLQIEFFQGYQSHCDKVIEITENLKEGKWIKEINERGESSQSIELNAENLERKSFFSNVSAKNNTKSFSFIIGESDFNGLMRERGWFVDKSLFIRDVIEEKSQVLLFTRPKRFGKTLNMSMLYYFFTNQNDFENRKHFALLKIWETGPKLWEQYQGRYPVIRLTFMHVGGSTYEECYQRICQELSGLYLQYYEELCNSPLLNKHDKEIIDNIVDQMKVMNLASEIIENALYMLIAYLHEYYNRKVILLIDEYDTPILASYLHGYYSKLIKFMSVFLQRAIKENSNLEKAVLTGILCVSKENIFSDLNNLCIYSLLSLQFSPYFGFTRREVETILEAIGLPKQMDEVTKWYAGYGLPEIELYNPWSIICHVQNRQKEEFELSWIGNSDYELIPILLFNSPFGIKADFLKLLEGSAIEKKIDENIVLQELPFNESMLWGFLLFTGHLSVKNKHNSDGNIIYSLVINNNELLLFYKNTFRNWLSQNQVDSEKIFESIEKENNQTILILINGFLEKINNIKDVSNQGSSYYMKEKDEDAYLIAQLKETKQSPIDILYSFLLGLSAVLHGKYRIGITENLDSRNAEVDKLIRLCIEPKIFPQASESMSVVVLPDKRILEIHYDNTREIFISELRNRIKIDRVDFIRQVVNDKCSVRYIAAPPLFGKSQNLKKLKNFIERNKISGKEEKKFPVIYLQGSRLAVFSLPELKEKFYDLLRDAYQQHAVVRGSLEHFEKRRYDLILQYPCLSEYESSRWFDFTRGLRDLTKYLHDYYKTPCWLLIDDFDTPYYYGLQHEYLKGVISFIIGCLKQALKDNPYLHKAVLMGICPTEISDSLSGLNNVVYSSQFDREYARYFGFTEQEVAPFILNLPQEEQLRLLQRIKDECGFGYRVQELVSRKELPIVFDCRALNVVRNDKLKFAIDRLANFPQHYVLIKSLIESMKPEDKEKVRLLLEGKFFECNVPNVINFLNIEEFLKNGDRVDLVWAFMLSFGHLKVAEILSSEYSGISQERQCRLMISNEKERQFLQSIMQKIKDVKEITIFQFPQVSPAFIENYDVSIRLQELFTQDKSSELELCVLYGMVGIGKTQIVTTYVNRHREAYSFWAWFNASTIESVQIEFSQLAGQMNLVGNEQTSQHELNERVKVWLSANPGWLLIFDNAQTCEVIASFIPASGGKVLITSRSSNWNVGKKIHIPLMTEEASITLIKKILIDIQDNEENNVRELAKKLGNLPLALAQAATYIKKQNITVRDYLQRYENEPSTFLIDDSLRMDVKDEHEPIAVSLQKFIDILKEQSEDVKLFLELISFLDNKPVPFSLLKDGLRKLQPNLNDLQIDKRFYEILDIIQEYSLLETNHQKETVLMHCVVQTFIQANLSQEAKDIYSRGRFVLLMAQDKAGVSPPTALLVETSKTAFEELQEFVCSSLILERTCAIITADKVKIIQYLERMQVNRFPYQAVYWLYVYSDVMRSVIDFFVQYGVEKVIDIYRDNVQDIEFWVKEIYNTFSSGKTLLVVNLLSVHHDSLTEDTKIMLQFLNGHHVSFGHISLLFCANSPEIFEASELSFTSHKWQRDKNELIQIIKTSLSSDDDSEEVINEFLGLLNESPCMIDKALMYIRQQPSPMQLKQYIKKYHDKAKSLGISSASRNEEHIKRICNALLFEYVYAKKELYHVLSILSSCSTSEGGQLHLAFLSVLLGKDIAQVQQTVQVLVERCLITYDNKSKTVIIEDGIVDLVQSIGYIESKELIDWLEKIKVLCVKLKFFIKENQLKKENLSQIETSSSIGLQENWQNPYYLFPRIELLIDVAEYCNIIDNIRAASVISFLYLQVGQFSLYYQNDNKKAERCFRRSLELLNCFGLESSSSNHKKNKKILQLYLKTLSLRSSNSAYNSEVMEHVLKSVMDENALTKKITSRVIATSYVSLNDLCPIFQCMPQNSSEKIIITFNLLEEELVYEEPYWALLWLEKINEDSEAFKLHYFVPLPHQETTGCNEILTSSEGLMDHIDSLLFKVVNEVMCFLEQDKGVSVSLRFDDRIYKYAQCVFEDKENCKSICNNSGLLVLDFIERKLNNENEESYCYPESFSALRHRQADKLMCFYEQESCKMSSQRERILSDACHEFIEPLHQYYSTYHKNIFCQGVSYTDVTIAKVHEYEQSNYRQFQKGKGRKRFNSSYQGRLCIFDTTHQITTSIVNIEDQLFAQKPVRCLIEGEAGIGKTSFCQYLIFKSLGLAHGDLSLWKNQFQLIWWLPLRGLLKLFQPECVFEFKAWIDLLCFDYVQKYQADKSLFLSGSEISNIKRQIQSFIQKQQLLIILDGYDEIQEFM